MADDNSTVIYWFSGSGNSLAVAKAIAGALGQASLTPLVGACHVDRPEPSTVGVVFPVHAFGLPRMVTEILRRMPLAADAYVFTVATAAALPGSVHRQAEEVLASRGIRLAAGWTVRMPLSFAPVPLPCSPRRKADLLAAAEVRVAAIARDVQQRNHSIREDSFRPLAWSLRGLHAGATWFFPRADRYFTALPNCSSCGLCARVCPVSNIAFDESGRPRWQGHCEACYACMQWCPVEAIRCGGPMPNRQRYTHPSVSSDDIAEQMLAHTAGD
jgi:ferredoxin